MHSCTTVNIACCTVQDKKDGAKNIYESAANKGLDIDRTHFVDETIEVGSLLFYLVHCIPVPFILLLLTLKAEVYVIYVIFMQYHVS